MSGRLTFGEQAVGTTKAEVRAYLRTLPDDDSPVALFLEDDGTGALLSRRDVLKLIGTRVADREGVDLQGRKATSLSDPIERDDEVKRPDPVDPRRPPISETVRVVSFDVQTERRSLTTSSEKG